MSWISDVKNELKQLDVSSKSLRKFGIFVGLIFLLIFVWFFTQSTDIFYSYIFLIIGAALFGFGLLVPNLLKAIFKVWMGFAFGIGWVVSRVILFLLFYVIISPIGVIARLIGKDFLNIKINEKDKTHWRFNSSNKKNDYLRMH